MMEFSDQVSEAVPAATVIMIRDGEGGLEALLLQRNAALSNMGGSWVFAGGKVDPADAGHDDEARALSGAIRELREETGIAIEGSDLVYFSHWLAPLAVKRRFATWFYIAAMPSDVQVVVDGSEMVAHRWVRPETALAEQMAGTLKIPPPTLVSLTDLLPFQSVADALNWARSRAAPFFFPRVVPHEDAMVFLYDGDAGFDNSDPSIQGARHRTVLRDGIFDYQRALKSVAS